jgi:signal transduction histidine kinase
VPLVILFYDGFSEGETRAFVIAMLAIFAVVPIALGVAPVQVAASVGLGVLIHLFSEGRALTLRAALAELKVGAEELRRANEHMQQINAKLEAQSIELQANYERLRTTQEQLLQSEKLAAIGQLAAGVAHEINNPLAVILGFAQVLDRRVEEGSPHRLPVASIVRESLRCKSLVQELLTFSRTGNKTPERIDLHSLLRGTAQLLESRARTQDTRLSLDLAGDVPEMSASSTQLQQVIVNLGNNALDAMGNGGELVIRSRCSGTGEVYVEVQDTGPGIPEAIRTRIFDPFFTTKEVGKGTGLGLSLAFEIVQQHGGTIDVESELGRGTTMRVRLPLGGRPLQVEARTAWARNN